MRTAVLALTFALSACGAANADSHVAEISLAELQPLVASQKVILVDANGTESYQEAHIPGAIDLEAHKADLASVLPAEKDALIVAYCGGPSCGAWQKGADAVAALGYTEVKHFKGGLSGWQAAKAPVEAVTR